MAAPARVPLTTAQTRLLVLWFAAALPVVLVVGAGLVGGRYAGHGDEAATWLMTALVPTLSLIVGVAGARALHREGEKPENVTVDNTFYVFSLALSGVYLALLLAVPLGAVFLPTVDDLQALKTSGLLLVPLQGLVSAALGALFVSRRD